eukprot:3893548-Pleurochrysis_carterae.AAC.1
MFYVVPAATIMKTIVYVGLRSILGCSTGSSRLCNLASLHYRSGEVSKFGWTMKYKWGHPVATFPSDGGDYTSLSLNDVNSANHHPFPGHEPTMPAFDFNHLAHKQPRVVKELPGFNPNYQITALGVFVD